MITYNDFHYIISRKVLDELQDERDRWKKECEKLKKELDACQQLALRQGIELSIVRKALEEIAYRTPYVEFQKMVNIAREALEKMSEAEISTIISNHFVEHSG